MTKRDREIIAEISRIRASNNLCWMSLLKLAVEKAPKEAKAVLRKIAENDASVNRLTVSLGFDEKGEQK